MPRKMSFVKPTDLPGYLIQWKERKLPEQGHYPNNGLGSAYQSVVFPQNTPINKVEGQAGPRVIQRLLNYNIFTPEPVDVSRTMSIQGNADAVIQPGAPDSLLLRYRSDNHMTDKPCDPDKPERKPKRKSKKEVEIRRTLENKLRVNSNRWNASKTSCSSLVLNPGSPSERHLALDIKTSQGKRQLIADWIINGLVGQVGSTIQPDSMLITYEGKMLRLIPKNVNAKLNFYQNPLSCLDMPHLKATGKLRVIQNGSYRFV
jgi:hypothetical protein